jgi:hypothetical protein
MVSFSSWHREPTAYWTYSKGPAPPGIFEACCCGSESDCSRHPWAVPWCRKVAKAKCWGYTVRLRYHEDPANQFVSFHIEFLEGVMLRNTSRWIHHITIGYSYDCPPMLLRALRRRWHMKIVHLPIHKVGNGTVFLHPSCCLRKCALVTRAHAMSWYSHVDLHISF